MPVGLEAVSDAMLTSSELCRALHPDIRMRTAAVAAAARQDLARGISTSLYRKGRGPGGSLKPAP
jgi:hypothetical protein